MDSISKVEYNVRSLTTRSVTLFPSRAQIFRDIKDVPLRPGLNEITIFGLSPTVDEHSIKVEGSGNAIISDIAVESLPNRDIFEHIYPDSDEDKSEDDSNPEDEEEPDFPESKELKAARAHQEQLQRKVDQVGDTNASTEAQHGILNAYAKTLKGEDGVEIEAFLDSYRRTADRLREDWFSASNTKKELQKGLDIAKKETERLLKKHRADKKQASRAWKKATLAKTKARIQEARREEERIKEKERVREEREKFWPKKCYAVRIQLTSNAVVNTPMTSRRGSISSEAEFVASPGSQDEKEKEAPASTTTTTCSLVLSYVTSSAFWTPSYDLQLSTSTGSGTLCFDAQLNNTTSESWSKCKITLSTSQVSSSSLTEEVPTLIPWHLTSTVSNSNNNNNNSNDSPFNSDSILQSREERNKNSRFWRQQQQHTGGKHYRKNLFGVEAPAPNKLQDYQAQLMLLEQQNKKRLMMARQEQDNNPYMARASAFGAPPPPPAMMQQQQLQAQQQQQQQQRPSFGGSNANNNAASLFGSAPGASNANTNTVTTGGLFGSSNSNVTTGGGGLFGGGAAYQTAQAPGPEATLRDGQEQPRPSDAPEDLRDFDFDTFLHAGEPEDESRLDFEESLVDETGFTTTYDLPGQKTLIPRSNSSKQRVARINLAKIIFSHTVIAKYKPVAHLSAKILNGSKLTLLKGPVGVTLDGSFMGRTNLPRCSSGESINLGLGIDPNIRVTYPRPEAKRATTGFFTKEDIKIFERCIRLENTKPVGPGSAPAKPVKIHVLDQIPVADSEKVRIELLKPEGLIVEGEWKEAGVPGREKEETDRDGATATAGLKKKGEINWNVTLKPGKALKLPLEYLVAVPIGEMAIQS